MASVPTVQIEDGAGGYLVINACDFDAARHTKLIDPDPAHFAPTLEQFTAAGYLPAQYPPVGFPEVASPGLTAYRASLVAATQAAPGDTAAYDDVPAVAAPATAVVVPQAAVEVVRDRAAIAAQMADTIEPGASVSAIDEALARRKRGK